jgi:hypothetical protein
MAEASKAIKPSTAISTHALCFFYRGDQFEHWLNNTELRLHKYNRSRIQIQQKQKGKKKAQPLLVVA